MTPLRTVPIENGHLAYVEVGSGPVVVLLHGGVLDHRMWSRQLDVLATGGYRVIAVDARGHGDSSTPTGPFRHCDDVATLLDHLATGPAVLVGLSMGAGTAVDVAVEHPRLVTALVVSGTGTSDPDWRDPWIIDVQATWARNAQERDAAAWIETFLRLGNGPHRSLDDVDPQIVDELREQAVKTVSTHIGDGAPIQPEPVPDVRQRGQEIDVPVLAIVGGGDFEDHIRLTRELAEAVDDGTTIVIDGTAHYPNMERPVLFNDAVLTFLDRVSSADTG